jgi:hypothetical protein
MSTETKLGEREQQIDMLRKSILSRDKPSPFIEELKRDLVVKTKEVRIIDVYELTDCIGEGG